MGSWELEPCCGVVSCQLSCDGVRMSRDGVRMSRDGHGVRKSSDGVRLYVLMLRESIILSGQAVLTF